MADRFPPTPGLAAAAKRVIAGINASEKKKEKKIMSDTKSSFTLIDYAAADGDEEADARPWPVRIETDEDRITILARHPDAPDVERIVWIEIAGGNLVAHCYDPAHDEPLNVSIGHSAIATYDDREGSAIAHNGARGTNPHVRTFFDLSLSHVSPDALKWLEGNAFVIATGGMGEHPVSATRDGYFVYAPDFGANGSNKRNTLHDDLFDAARLARAAGCAYMLFDPDAEVVDGLPTYEDPADPGDEGLTEEEIAARAVADEHAMSNPPRMLPVVEEDGGLADELAEPSELESFITERMAEKVAEREFIHGDGIGRPLGILDDMRPLDDAPEVADHGRNPTDRDFLLWIRDRLTLYHGDGRNVDFIWKLEAIAEALPKDQRTPSALTAHPATPEGWS